MKPRKIAPKHKRRAWHRARVMKYRADRIELIEKLGGRCDECGETAINRLEFDHLNPRTWVCRDFGRWNRIKLYAKEASEGLIRLLCRSCNARTRPKAKALA